jgi:hypothetical protein
MTTDMETPVAEVPARVTGTWPPALTKVSAWWWFAAAAAVGGAAAACVFTARATGNTTPHRAAAAGTALGVVVALALLAHAILLWYQAQAGLPAGSSPGQPTLNFRRRGLKAAVIGQDGRASTSKTQVVLWTAAVVWGLVDLLLLARAFGGTGLFTGAVTTNWRPEYLVLLGLPVAAATAAKAAVANANDGRGPVDRATARAAAAEPGPAARVYVREPLPHGVRGVLTGLAELMTGDDNAVAWADLQYVVFTGITLCYFAIQLLGQPKAGLPPVPAALLTLMGVSASGYAANKIVSTKGTNTKAAAARS